MRSCKIYLLLLSSLLYISCSGEQRDNIVLSPGKITLDGYDFNRDGLIPLSCQWEFYWQQLLVPADFVSSSPQRTGYIQVPGVWNGYNAGIEIAGGNGYATYRLTVKNLPPGSYGLKIPTMATAYRLWVNNLEVASSGSVAADNEMIPRQMPLVAFFNTTGEDIIITVQVSNYMSDKGGMWDKILLGTQQQVMKKRIFAIAFDLMLFGSILIMSFYHFALYFFRKKTVFTLYFGLLCLVIAFRVILTGEFFLVYLIPDINWHVEIKIEFITAYGGFAFFLLFINSLYKNEVSQTAVRSFMAACCIFLLLTIVFPISFTGRLLPVFHGIIVAGFIYMLYVLVRAVMKNREGAVYILAGCLVLTIVVINDILDANAIIHTGYLFPVGLLIFIFSQSVILARIFAVSLKQVEELSGQLQVSYNRIDEYNRNLEAKIDERTAELADANEKLRELDRAKTDFFANISHELRTPLTLILAPVEDALSGKQVTAESLKLIRRNGYQLLSLINDLLDISRITAGRMTLEVRECDLCTVVRRCCGDMEQAALMNGVELSCETIYPSVYVYIDETRIARVLANFFSNSLKFTGRGGLISVKVYSNGGNAIVDFSDTGCGIPADKISTIFERFVQAETGPERRYGGTGLGLSIVRDLVELHSGTVSVESRYIDDYPSDHGSVFRVTIPLGSRHFENRKDIIFAGKSMQETSVPLLNDVDITTTTSPLNIKKNHAPDVSSVLVVEDNNDLRMFLENMLAESFVVYTACNGNEAIAVLGHEREIDLVVSDIMMPEMDGHELLQWMRSNEEFKHIPVIFLTARADHFMKIEALGLGAVDYVTKPFNSDELLLRIRNQMEQKKMRNALHRNYARIIAKLGRAVNSAGSVTAGSRNDINNINGQSIENRMEQVCTFIQEHYYEDITRESLASVVELNPDTFSRHFNQYTGKSLADYINVLRIDEAKRKLADTDSPITRISIESGFDSIRTFNRVFKKHTGMNPGEFRQSAN